MNLAVYFPTIFCRFPWAPSFKQALCLLNLFFRGNDAISQKHTAQWSLVRKKANSETSWQIYSTTVSNRKTHLADFETWATKKLFTSTVSNKNTNLPVFEICVFLHISPEPLKLQKSYLHLFAFLSEELSDEKNNFWYSVTKSGNIFKNAVLPEKK